MEKYGSVRIQKMAFDKSYKKGGRYYKSYIQQMEHDLRREEMDATYLARPEEANKYHTFSGVEFGDMWNTWKECQKDHEEHRGKKIQHQTKGVINFLISFSKDFDLPELERQRQFDIVKAYFAEKYDYPVYVVQHNDEKALHYSACVINYDKQNHRPLAKQINTSKLQDEVFDYLKEHHVDYGHKRGKPKVESAAKHRTIMEGKVKELEEKITLLEEEKTEIQRQKIEVEKELEEVENLREGGLHDLKAILNDFIDLGLNYKGKDGIDLTGLFKRYLSRQDMEKAEKLQDKIEKMVKKHEEQGKKGRGNTIR